VDSHHLRIVQRLGFVNKGATAREAEARIMEMAPANWPPAMLDDHHSLIKLHGQKCCTKNGPRCSRCPLRNICPAASS
jgi:endonuclease-3